MRFKAFTILEILIIFFAIVIIAAVMMPLGMSDASQGRRVAAWHMVFDELEYSFNLAKVQNGSIFGDNPSNLTDREYFEKVKPFLNIDNSDDFVHEFEKYHYTYRNKTYVKRSSKYYFDNFFMLKNNVIASIKKNTDKEDGKEMPYVFMFVDVNGFKKPNRIGDDIFFINIFNDRITAYGDGYSLSKLSAGCSKIGKGLFCSKYYLVGSNL